MRIDLSKKWQQSRLFLLCLIAVISVGTAVFCIWSNSEEDYIMCLCAAWCILAAACLLFFSRRLCTYAIIEEDHIQSFSATSHKFALSQRQMRFTMRFSPRRKARPTAKSLLQYQIVPLNIRKHTELPK